LFDYTPSGWGSPVPQGEIYNYDVDYMALAPYLRLEQPLGDDLLLTAGLRYDSNRFDYTNNLATIWTRILSTGAPSSASVGRSTSGNACTSAMPTVSVFPRPVACIR